MDMLIKNSIVNAISAVFIDRDGTLNVDVGYLGKPDDVIIIPGSAEALARLNAEKIPVIVVTNQSGIGRGLYNWSDFRAVMHRIANLLAVYGAHIDGVYAAPHHQNGLGRYAHVDHPDRKPNPGMLLRAAKQHGINLSNSWMIGDKKLDLDAGRNAGCNVALVRTGCGTLVDCTLADLVADNLEAAIDCILTSSRLTNGNVL